MNRRGESPALAFVVDGIEIEVARKNIKNMYIRVLPPDGRVRVSAPWRVGDETVRTFVEDRAGWIRSHAEAMRSRPGATPRYVTGDKHFLWGEAYTLELRYASKGTGVSVEGDVLALTVQEATPEERRGAVMKSWYREQLRERLPELFTKWEKITSVHAAEVRVRDMRTRWGTCSVKKRRIWLGLALAQRPTEQLEYVVAHELTHLIEPSHNARFKALMDGFMPDWRRRKAALNGR